MRLIVGLGNPGSQYERTRHNVGFMVIDRLAQKHGAANFRVAHEGFAADIHLAGQKTILLKPQTFMNLAGRSVASAMQFYKIAMADLLVVVDDIALPVGLIRLRVSGWAGGHNGLKDIQRAIGNFALMEMPPRKPEDYPRLRIGIDPPGRVPQKVYVLEAFSPAQKPELDKALGNAVAAIECWAEAGIQIAMTRYNPPPTA